jgi:hypothetical protein
VNRTGPTSSEHREWNKTAMVSSPLEGKADPREILIDRSRLEREYFARRPDVADSNKLVGFGKGIVHRALLSPDRSTPQAGARL